MLEKLAGPVIGALIGYCTNYIAVKMLFFPKKEVRFLGHKLPFTPGAIPKGKPRLAKAIGNIVANDLLTQEDIKQKLLAPDAENTVADQIIRGLSTELHRCISSVCPADMNYDVMKDKLIINISDQIMDSVQNMKLDEILVQEAGKAVKEKTKGTMIDMFLSDKMLDSILQPIGEKVVSYIDEKGPEFIRAELDEKMDALGETSVLELCDKMDISEGAVRAMISSVYQKAVDFVVGSLLENLDISGMIEEKVNAMDVDTLEDMVLHVMKSELDMIVNLGALVGAILGILNIFL